jgi:hypothetical protein
MKQILFIILFTSICWGQKFANIIEGSSCPPSIFKIDSVGDQKEAFDNLHLWNTKYDTTKYFHINNRLYFDTLHQSRNGIVCEVDSGNNITVPNGWEYILVIKNGECWAFDSSRTHRNISQPNFRR